MYLSELHRTRILIGDPDDGYASLGTPPEETFFLNSVLPHGIDFNNRRKEILLICSVTFIVLVYAFFAKSLLILLFNLLIPFFYCWFLKRSVTDRALRFEKDYPVMLVSLSSAVRTGKDPLSAFLSLKVQFNPDSEMFQEIDKVQQSIEKGRSEDEAFGQFGKSIVHPDISLFCAAFILARKEGSSLGPCLQRLTKVTRQRQSFRRKAKASLAMQRLSASGIVVCCFVIGLMQFGINPKGMSDAWNHPFGHKIIFTGLVLIFAGMYWMTRISKARV